MLRLSGKIKYIILFVLATQYQFVPGQDIPVYNQYFSDYSLICSALTGKDNCYAIGLTDQHQWLGIEGAPNTQAVYGSGKFGSSDKGATSYHGLGLLIARDANGPYSVMRISGTYSFHVLISEARKMHLAFALIPSFSQSVLNQGDFLNYNNDPLITGEHLSVWNPNAEISAAVYNSYYFAGASVMDIFPQISYLSDPVEADRNSRQYFIIGGYRFHNRQNNMTFEPSAVFRFNEHTSKQLDLNLKVYSKEIFWSGISYRYSLDAIPGSTINILPTIGVFIKNLELSYTFDLGFKGLQNRSLGSHYIYLGWRLCKENRGSIPCPVYK